ncbi:MAG: tyrosine-protein phosphatase [Bacilli bacterium]|nr:tyrosine-protein phosphatase [Bacilli bacterium]
MKTYELSKQKNIRDLGGMATKDGHHIKYGKLIRGGALLKLSEEDQKAIDELHLTDIIDFRSSSEYLSLPTYQPSGVRTHNIPVLKMSTNEEAQKRVKSADGNLLWFLEDQTSGFEHLRKVYREFVTTDEGKSAFRKFFEIIMQPDAVTYFHCSQGKDRTGFAAYLFEIAVGVSEEDAMEDYLFSNIAMEKRAEALLRSVEYRPFYNEEYKKNLVDVFSTKVEYMKSAVDAMNEFYGGTKNFIEHELGVNIATLRERFLEK